MNAEWSEALGHAVRDVFEQLCFMLPADEGSPAAERVSVEVAFRGARSGVLCVSLPESMVSKVAGAMLGDDDSIELEEQHAAICELANIVCGNALPLIAGERGVCELDSPRILAATDAAGAAPDAEVVVPLDEGVVLARIIFSSELEAGAA
jgi:CheY-specific phosphatase CheX